MGTNYYLQVNVCPHCSKPESELHIGKSSAGWCFSLHVDPAYGINSLDHWLVLFNTPNNRIRNEYGDSVPVAEMLKIITERSWPHPVGLGYESQEHFYEDNHAQPGPNGLCRHKIEDGQCIAHGIGTWDCIVGEFR